jgi:hypothetical protein
MDNQPIPDPNNQNAPTSSAPPSDTAPAPQVSVTPTQNMLSPQPQQQPQVTLSPNVAPPQSQVGISPNMEQPAQPNMPPQALTPKKSKTRLIIAAAALVVGIIIIIFLAVILGHTAKATKSSTNTNSATKSSKSSSGSLSEAYTATQVKSDIGKIISIAMDYWANNNGTFPTSFGSSDNGTSVYFCGATCTSADSQDQTGALDFFKASNMSFKPVSASLSVPNINTVYLVDNTQCNAQSTGLDTQAQGAQQMAALYAIQSSGKLDQTCFAE